MSNPKYLCLLGISNTINLSNAELYLVALPKFAIMLCRDFVCNNFQTLENPTSDLPHPASSPQVYTLASFHTHSDSVSSSLCSCSLHLRAHVHLCPYRYHDHGHNAAVSFVPYFSAFHHSHLLSVVLAHRCLGRCRSHYQTMTRMTSRRSRRSRQRRVGGDICSILLRLAKIVHNL